MLSYISIYGCIDLVDLGRLFSFLIYIQSVGLLGRVSSPSQGRYLHKEQHKLNKRTQTFMPRVEIETMIPVFERAKTVHALERGATLIDCPMYKLVKIFQNRNYRDMFIFLAPT
jgi:hypothetical protein